MLGSLQCASVVCPSVRPSIRPSVRPSVRPCVRPSVCPSVRPSVRASVRLSVCPSVRPSLRPSVRPSVRGHAHHNTDNRDKHTARGRHIFSTFLHSYILVFLYISFLLHMFCIFLSMLLYIFKIDSVMNAVAHAYGHMQRYPPPTYTRRKVFHQHSGCR